MPVYQYKGFKGDGNAAAGIIDAESPKGARSKLRKVGVFPTEIAEQSQAIDTIGRVIEQPGGDAGRTLSTQDLATLTRQLATLLVAGLPLVDALSVLIEQAEKKAVQTILADIREQIREGKALSAALGKYPRDISPIYVHMIHAGETSGALDQILFRLADFLENQVKLKSKVTSAALYPALMLAVGITVLFFLMTFVVPKITAVFADLHQALPWPTRLLIAVSGVLSRFWVVLLAGAIL
ncbi:MAG: type II secretion system F family protein, partial [Nitrospirota bacterium]|nr:type II secretion system F family protein [Nitrospirota bacterium]